MADLTASPAEQLALLELQHTDTALDQAKARMQRLRQDPEFGTLRAAVVEKTAEAEQAQEHLDQARAALAAAEQKVTATREHRDRNQKRLDAGQGGAKDLENMMHEISTLQTLIGEQEDAELEAMDAVEQAEAGQADAARALQEARGAAAERQKAVEQEAAQVSAQGRELTQRRAQQAAALPAPLVELYERLRTRNQGIGAARLDGNRSGASGMTLSPADLDQITRAAPDALTFCPDTGALLVRTQPNPDSAQ